MGYTLILHTLSFGFNWGSKEEEREEPDVLYASLQIAEFVLHDAILYCLIEK
jgi:hypothetical protein